MKNPRLTALLERLCGLAEGLCLAGLAGSVYSLYVGNTLWYFINPKYQTLILATAAAMAGLGFFAALVPPRPARFMRPVIFAMLLSLCQFGGAQALFNPKPGQGVLSEPQTEPSQDGPPSRETWRGREYIRINLGELYDICAARHTTKLDLSYLVQGFVARGVHEAVIFRMSLFCCFADATAVAFRIKPDKDELPKNGTWVEAYGHLEKAKPGKPPKMDLGAGFSSINPDYVFVVERFDERPAPSPPFMFEWRDKEPYAF